MPAKNPQDLIAHMSAVILRGYAIAKSLGYTGSSLDYAMAVQPPDMVVTDTDGNGNSLGAHTVGHAPTNNKLLKGEQR